MRSREIDLPLGQASPSDESAPSRQKYYWGGGIFIFSFLAVFFLQDSDFSEFISGKKTASYKTSVQSHPPYLVSQNRMHSNQKYEAVPNQNTIIVHDPLVMMKRPENAHLPNPDFLEQTELGLLPVISSDGRRPFDLHSRPFLLSSGPKIAIVIGGLGLSQTGTAYAIDSLPPDVTFAFAPDGKSIARWMEKIRRKGHEFIMQLPLEPFDYPRVNPGNNTLTVDAEESSNVRHLEWVLSRTINYVGVMNYMGGRFIKEHSAFQPIMAELGKRGLLFLDDGSSPQSVAPKLALNNGMPFLQGDFIIDDVPEHKAILEKLDQLERLARMRGWAVATGSALVVTIDIVNKWIHEAGMRNIQIVPVSSLARDPQRDDSSGPS